MKPKGNSGGTSSLGSTWPADRAEPRNGWPQVLAGFFSAKNETAAKAKGVKRLCIPNRAIKSPERKREQKKRWFRNGQNGVPDARVASAWSSDGKASIAADTRVMPESSAGWASGDFWSHLRPNTACF